METKCLSEDETIKRSKIADATRRCRAKQRDIEEAKKDNFELSLRSAITIMEIEGNINEFI